MSASSIIREYGLVGAIDSMANMCGEQLAIITELVPCSPHDNKNNLDNNEVDQDTPQIDENNDEELEWEAKGVTYFELQQISTFLSNQMYMRLGIRPGDRVLIFGYGSTAAELTAMLACMRLKTVFVPISVSYDFGTTNISDKSKSTLDHIIHDCEPTSAIIVGANDEDPVVQLLSHHGIYRYSLIDRNGAIIEEDPSAYYSSFQQPPDEQLVLHEENVITDNTSSDILYILYTSGSTGIQKGVMGSHRGLINRLEYQYSAFPYNFNEVVVRRTPLSFVDAMVEVFAPVLAGVPICAYLFDRINKEGVLSIAKECSLLGITRMTLIPSQLLQWCSHLLRSEDFLQSLVQKTEDSDDNEDCDNGNENDGDESNPWSSITHIFVSGEECSQQVVQLCQQCFPTVKLVNLYGTTEITGDVTASLLYDGSQIDSENRLNRLLAGQNTTISDRLTVPIGTCIPGNFLFLVQENNADEDNNSTSNYEIVDFVDDQTKQTVEGELMVIGEHVALGYFQQSAALRNRFIPNPFLITDDNDTELIESLCTTLSNYIQIPGYVVSSSEDDNDDKADSKTLPMSLLAQLQQYSMAFVTGDIVKYAPYESSKDNKQSEVQQMDGEWLWLGRKDRMIKHHGQKVALDALETKLCRLFSSSSSDDISNYKIAATYESTPLIVVSLPSANQNSSTLLAVVILPSFLLNPSHSSSDETFTSSKSFKSLFMSKLRSSSLILLEHEKPTLVLPYHADHFPLTASYKIDRMRVVKEVLALLDTTSITETTSNSDPNSVVNKHKTSLGDNLEDFLYNMMVDVLQLSKDAAGKVNYDEVNFYLLGGDSVSGIELLWRLRQFDFSPLLAGSNMTQKKDRRDLFTPEQLQLPISALAQSIKNSFLAASSPTAMKHDNSTDDNHEERPIKRAKLQEHYSKYDNNILYKRIYPENTSIIAKCDWQTVIYRANRTNSAPSVYMDTVKLTDSSDDGNKNYHKTANIDTKWSQPLRKCIDASPTILTSTSTSTSAVLVGCHGGEIAMLDVVTGNRAWHIRLQSSLFATDHIESAIVVDTKYHLALVTSYLGNDIHAENAKIITNGNHSNHRGRVWACDLYTGDIAWTQTMAGECKASALVLHTSQSVLAGDYLGNISVFDAKTGTIRATLADLNGAIFATPALLSTTTQEASDSTSHIGVIEEEILVVTTRGSVYGVLLHMVTNNTNNDAPPPEYTLSVKWSYETEGACLFATPAVFYRNHRNNVTSTKIDSNNHKHNHNHKHSSSSSSSSSDNFDWVGIVLAGTDGSIRYIQKNSTSDADTAAHNTDERVSIRWLQEDVSRQGSPFFSSPAIISPNNHENNNMDSNNHSSMVVLGNHDGMLRCCTCSSGDCVAEIDLQSVIFASPSILRVENYHSNHGHNNNSAYVVAVATTAGIVYILELRNDTSDDTWQFQILGQSKLPAEVFSSPVLFHTTAASNNNSSSSSGRADNGTENTIQVVVGCRDDRVYALQVSL